MTLTTADTDPVVESPVRSAARPAPPRPAKGVRRRLERERDDAPWTAQALFAALGISACLGGLEGLSRSGAVPERFLPPVTEILPEAVRILGRERFWTDAYATLHGWVLGFGAAVTLGLVLGFVFGSHPLLRRLTASTIDFLRPIPSVAFIPVVVLVFGTKLESKLVLTIYAATWPVLLQTILAIREVDPLARATARTLHMRRLGVLRHVVWPSALPFLATGVRLSASVALVLCVAAELIIGNPGLGKDVALAKDGAAFDRMYALILLIGLIGMLINLALSVGSRILLRHYPADLAGRRP